MPKILFFDVDGTLSIWVEHGNPYLPQSAINAIRETRKLGNLCFMATGRSMPEITDDLIDIGFDGYITGAGNSIFYNDKIIRSTKLSKENVKEIVDTLTKYDACYSVEGDKGIYICDKMYKRIKKTGDYFFMNLCKYIYKEIHYDDVNKICFDADINSFNKIKDLLTDKYYFYNSSYLENNTGSGEISLKGVSKGSAIEYLLDYLKISKEDSYGFGDSDNDIEMLKVCGTSIVLGKHSKGVEPYADFITKNVEDDGLEYAMKRFGLI